MDPTLLIYGRTTALCNKINKKTQKIPNSCHPFFSRNSRCAWAVGTNTWPVGSLGYSVPPDIRSPRIFGQRLQCQTESIVRVRDSTAQWRIVASAADITIFESKFWRFSLDDRDETLTFFANQHYITPSIVLNSVCY